MHDNFIIVYSVLQVPTFALTANFVLKVPTYNLTNNCVLKVPTHALTNNCVLKVPTYALTANFFHWKYQLWHLVLVPILIWLNIRPSGLTTTQRSAAWAPGNKTAKRQIWSGQLAICGRALTYFDRFCRIKQMLEWLNTSSCLGEEKRSSLNAHWLRVRL